MSAPAVEFLSVSKRYPAAVALALQDITLSIRGGEIHGVIGENGAGKSTLMKILAGHERVTSGELKLTASVAMIHQELNLVDELSVADNIFLGRERRRLGFIDRRWQNAEARRLLASLRCGDIDVRRRCADLPIAQRQMVEIAKALSVQARVLILDEPTAVLSSREIDALFAVMEDLKSQGVTMLYISHLLPEVIRICDRATVLRDGRLVRTLETAELKAATDKQLASMMVGRPMDQHFPVRTLSTSSEVALEVRNLTVPGHVRDASFQVRPGEIVGFAGLIGAGRTELAEAVAGLRRRSSGEVIVHGRTVASHPQSAVRAGVAYLSEDRKGTGLTLGMSVLENTTLASLHRHTLSPLGLLRRSSELAATRSAITSMSIKTAGPAQRIDNLSGGNQQKVALAKWLETRPKVLIVDEPTRGVDIGAKEQIYKLITDYAASGAAVVLISSELTEILGLAHRILVLRQGQIVGELPGETATEEQIMHLAAGSGRADGTW
jgi:ribose transport system ATP-binding protein